ncbi:hypothetical protein BVRB_4g096170 [Beta vulgaris subsp. vulgaris]|uniref:Uncharacterized protein n=1 Tax=Beta vulgaris subsp. vulgaris TaxID=3555 RepID=A0A0J8E4K8_BETVV|nr:hypothetical protein BVRB_4g096170 [Beta vulgaris subsp. vulgaris]
MPNPNDPIFFFSCSRTATLKYFFISLLFILPILIPPIQIHSLPFHKSVLAFISPLFLSLTSSNLLHFYTSLHFSSHPTLNFKPRVSTFFSVDSNFPNSNVSIDGFRDGKPSASSIGRFRREAEHRNSQRCDKFS